jgi:hypothetical protein
MARMVADILNDDFRNVINLNFRGTSALVRPIKNSALMDVRFDRRE